MYSPDITQCMILSHILCVWLYSIVVLQKTPEDVNNFDPDFTQEEPTLTPIDDPMIPSINQEEFRNFSFTSPELLEN